LKGSEEMGKSKEGEILVKILEKAKKDGKITGEDMAKLYSTFGKRFLKAWEALKERKVKKYTFNPSRKVVWVVVGKERDYLILPAAEFCTCDDFYFRVIDQEIHMCYHLIAQKIAEALNWFDKIEEGDELYETLMKEWTKITT